MKQRTAGTFIVATILVCMALLLGCDFNAEETFTVWTDSESYTEFQSATNTTLNDGMYVRVDITNSQWQQISSSLPSSCQHNWTQDKIKDWFLGRGFGETEATKESSWIATTDHGMIASRTGSTVYFIVK